MDFSVQLSKAVDFSDATARAPIELSLDPAGGMLQLDTLIIDGNDEAPDLNVLSIIGDAPQAPRRKQEIAQLMEQAKGAHQDGDLKRLREYMNRILEIDPENARAYFNIGVLDRDRGAYPEAEAR